MTTTHLATLATAVLSLQCVGESAGGGQSTPASDATTANTTDALTCKLCTPAASKSCACTNGGTGSQTCASTGCAWGTCACVTADATTSDGPTVADVAIIDAADTIVADSAQPTCSVCAPGDSKACACTNGASGAQVCQSNACAWEKCVCDTPDVAPPDIAAPDQSATPDIAVDAVADTACVACKAGTTKACACLIGGTGSQVCAANGCAWGDCMCSSADDADAGPGPDAKTDASDVSCSACVPGDSKACACTSGAPGAQVCTPNACGYGTCVCQPKCAPDCSACKVNADCAATSVCSAYLQACSPADGQTYQIEIIAAVVPFFTGGLPWDADNSAADPYVEVFINASKVCVTGFVSNMFTPTWNFTCPAGITVKTSDTLTVKVWDKDVALNDLIDFVSWQPELPALLHAGAYSGPLGKGGAKLAFKILAL